MTDKIKAMFIFEILGKPPEFIIESLETHIKNLEKIKGIKILNKKINEPKPLDKQKIYNEKKLKPEEISNLYTSFAEVEIEVDSLSLLFSVCFLVLPSHIEIIQPDELRYKNFELSLTISELAVKLHKYDEVVKILTMEKQHLENQLRIYRGDSGKIEELKKKETNKK